MSALPDTTIPTQAPTSPSLIDAINDYREGSRAFLGWERREFADEEEAIEATYGPSMRILSDWNAPVVSLEEVREAIRLAFSEDTIIAEMISEPLRAALIYLDKITGWKNPEGGEV